MARAEDITEAFGSLPGVRLSLGSSSAIVTLHGAHVVSYIHDEREMLFMSDLAVKNGKTPIRGGIPLVFPQFGKGKIMSVSHGFARRSTWRHIGGESSDGAAVASFELIPEDLDETYRSAWPKHFRLVYTVTLTSASLLTELLIENLDESAFDFQALLHTYFNVDSITDVTVSGTEGTDYIDQLADGATVRQDSSPIVFDKETDRIYTSPESAIRITGCGCCNGNSSGEITLRTSLERSSSGTKKAKLTPDAVVWNPWFDKSKRMSDFRDLDYLRMLCVEPGCVSSWHTVETGDSVKLAQEIVPLFPREKI